jgi:hypothetical protein
MLSRRKRLPNILSWVQGLVCIVTGLWPVFDINSFMYVTGPKTDIWLVKTVGLILTALGIGLIAAVLKKQITHPVILIALLNALALAGIDIYYATNDTISDVYLADAVLEITIAAGWIVVLKNHDTHWDESDATAKRV